MPLNLRHHVGPRNSCRGPTFVQLVARTFHVGYREAILARAVVESPAFFGGVDAR